MSHRVLEMLAVFVACLSVCAVASAKDLEVFTPGFFDNVMGSRSGLQTATEDQYACERFEGRKHSFVNSYKFKKIQKYCGSELSFRHIQPVNSFVSVDRRKDDTGFYIVCCKGKAAGPYSYKGNFSE